MPTAPRLTPIVLAFALVLACVSSLRAQVTHRLEVTATEASLDGVRLVPATGMPLLVRALGEPSRRESADGFELALWDTAGIVVRHRGAVVHEVTLVLRSQGLVLPGGEVFRDPAEPTGTFTGSVTIGGAALPASVTGFAPSGLTCVVGSDNHRCALASGVVLHVSPENGPAELVVVRLR